MTNDVTFDYLQNDGRFDLYADTTRQVKFTTWWTPAGKGSIWALDQVDQTSPKSMARVGTDRDHKVAFARHRSDIKQIDDPSGLDFDTHTCLVKEGGIVSFRNEAGYALIKVTSVLAGSVWGDDRFELSFSYDLRLED